MSNRITVKNLEWLVSRINDALGVPQEPYKHDADGKAIRDANGRMTANAGTVYLGGAYGGYRFEQMCKGGGCRDLSSSGYCSKRELYEIGQAYLHGIGAKAELEGRI